MDQKTHKSNQMLIISFLESNLYIVEEKYNDRNIVFWNAAMWNVVNRKGFNLYNYKELIKRAKAEFTRPYKDDDENHPGRHGSNVSVHATSKALAKATNVKAWKQKEEVWKVDLFGELLVKMILQHNLNQNWLSKILKHQKSKARLGKLKSKLKNYKKKSQIIKK